MALIERRFKVVLTDNERLDFLIDELYDFEWGESALLIRTYTQDYIIRKPSIKYTIYDIDKYEIETRRNSDAV